MLEHSACCGRYKVLLGKHRQRHVMRRVTICSKLRMQFSGTTAGACWCRARAVMLQFWPTKPRQRIPFLTSGWVAALPGKWVARQGTKSDSGCLRCSCSSGCGSGCTMDTNWRGTACSWRVLQLAHYTTAIEEEASGERKCQLEGSRPLVIAAVELQLTKCHICNLG